MTLNTYLQKMNEASGLTTEDILGRSRRRECCAARYILWFYLRNTELWSTIRIGRSFNRDHVTVMHGLKCADNYKENKTSYAMEYKMWGEFEELLKTN